ncbi:MAG: M48 family metalloprotease [Candidatus Odinarchaeota archaeon]
MPMRLYLRSLWVLTLLWGIVFVLAMVLSALIAMLGLYPAGFKNLVIALPVIFALLIVGLQFLISPWIMDITISWVYNATKYQVSELPPHIREFIFTQMEEYNFSLKWVAIIHDNNPNAFTYGHTKKRARLAITEGILNYLEEDEQLAVVGHECGHIIHRDFIWMTVAAAIPLICYSFYQSLWTFARISTREGRGSSDTAKVGAIAYAVAIGAFIAYYISHFLVLLLSRVREYYADSFSGTLVDPGALSRALVKIAYGMVKEDAENSQIMNDKNAAPTERKQASRRGAFTTGMRSLGIFDISGARSLAMTSYGQGTATLDNESIAKAAQWDLSNPWGRFLELQSTHPLPAKRIKALNRMQEEQGRQPEFPGIGLVKLPESLWDEFLVDIFLQYVAPLLFFLLPIIGGVVASLASLNPLIGVGTGFLVFALIWKWRRHEKYPKLRDSDPIVTVVNCLTDQTKNSYYEASPLRGKPAVFEGRVIGRGTPGYWLSEDLVIKDQTGIITLDYSPAIPIIGGLLAMFFALFRVQQLQGSMVRAYGWYHRVPMPLLQIWKIVTEDGKVYKNRWSGLNQLFMWFCVLLGLVLLAVGFV